MLRLLLLRLDDLDRPPQARRIDAAKLEALPTAYSKVYLRPHLSEVGIRAGIGWIRDHSIHFDFDWFGPEEDNWWPFGGTGRSIEIDVATGLLHFLEDSLGLQRTTKVDPATWSWPAEVNGKNWYAKFASPGDPGATGFDDLKFEWYVDDAQQGLTVTSNSEVCRISTPWPSREDWYK